MRIKLAAMHCGVALLAVCVMSGAATAAPITVTVGDDDGYGQGIADGGNMPIFMDPWNFRSAAEATATNGVNHTDLFGAFGSAFSGHGLPQAFDVVFPFVGTLTSGSLVVDMASRQFAMFSAFAVSANGVSLPGFLDFLGAPNQTALQTVALPAAAVTAANAAGQVVLRINRNGSPDEVAFDYFRLNADVTTPTTTTTGGTGNVPEPSSLGLVAMGAVAWAAYFGRRRRRGQR